MVVTKRSGEKVKYVAAKLRKSLMKSGASGKVVKEIIEEVENMLYPGIPTEDIYSKAFTLLRKEHRAIAAKYNLKKAIHDLGPSGFPFERYVSHLLEVDGYDTDVGVILEGKCVSHEIDIVATKGMKIVYYECKFHNKSTYSCNVKTPLYIQSRFLDIDNRQKELNVLKSHSFGIVTNTTFTSEATKYANCVGLKLLSWNYPLGNALREQIDRANMHPITCLTTLSKKEKYNLLNINVVLCRHVMNDSKPLENIGISTGRIPKIMGEAKALFELS